MAEKKKKAAQIVAFTPEAITLSIGGEEVLVAITKQENAFLNMVLASQGRTLIQKSIKAWQDQEQTPTPKELRDIAGAMKDIASFSAEVYATAEPLYPKEKKEEKPAEDIDFNDLTKPPEPNGNETDRPVGHSDPTEAPKTDTGTPSGEPSEGDPGPA